MQSKERSVVNSGRAEPNPIALRMLERLGVSTACSIATRHSAAEVFLVRKHVAPLGRDMPVNVRAGLIVKALNKGVGADLLTDPSELNALDATRKFSFERHLMELSKFDRLPPGVEKVIRTRLQSGASLHRDRVWRDDILLLAGVESADLIERFVRLAATTDAVSASSDKPPAETLVEEEQLQRDVDRSFGLRGRDDSGRNTDPQLIGPESANETQ
ncbi:MAG: hypothetical protein AAF937_09895 [Planctomycetota bacterium]